MSDLYTYQAQLVRCVDGDTFDASVSLGYYVVLKLRFRLLDVDTPERGQTDYNLARMVLDHLIRQQMDEEGYFRLESVKTGKFGRWLARIEGVNEELAKRWPYESKG